MSRRNKKTKRYFAPHAVVQDMALESNFCQTLPLNAQVDEIHNMNPQLSSGKENTAEDPFYFEF